MVEWKTRALEGRMAQAVRAQVPLRALFRWRGLVCGLAVLSDRAVGASFHLLPLTSYSYSYFVLLLRTLLSFVVRE